MQAPLVTLTCAQCQRRKIKCDKKSPCGPCNSAHMSCVAVQRLRKPRGRHSSANNKTAEMRARVSRLETLVQNLEASANSSESLLAVNKSCSRQTSLHTLPISHERTFDHVDQPMEPTTTPFGSGTGNKSVIAGSFWAALSDEVSGLREILDEGFGDDGDEKIYTTKISHPSYPVQSLHSPLFPPKPYLTERTISEIISHDKGKKLLDVYEERVDPIFKVGHWPSIRNSLTVQHRKLGDSSTSALQSAIYFMGFCTLSNDECIKYVQFDKEFCVHMARQDAEHHLTAADLLNTTEIIVLQAFVVYLTGLRICENSRSSWTMIAIAVRIATALGINAGETSNLSFLQSEIRKRLWYTIGLLDIRSALDRGSSPLLPLDGFIEPPSVLNDIELLYATGSRPHSPLEYTDMAFCSMTFEAMNVCRRLCQVPLSLQSVEADWNEKLHYLENFKHRFQVKYAITRAADDLIAKFTSLVASGIVVTLELLLRRPLYKSRYSSIPSSDGFDVLKVATEVLEHGEMKVTSAAFQKWQWYSWLKWFALAVVLTELCGRGSGPSADRAWAVVDNCFERYGHGIADSATGMLWKPILKLHHRAKRARDRDLKFLHHRKLQEIRETNGSSINIDEGLSLVKLSYEVSKAPISRPDHVDTSDVSLSNAHASTHYLQNDQPAAALEAEALSWINWEIFVEDMNDDTRSSNEVE